MPSKKIIALSIVALITALVAWLVMGLGAYTRLMDAGLGCPDWPGCYGHFSVPIKADIARPFSSSHFIAEKSWIEMIHRYAAGTLGLLIALAAILATIVAMRHGFRFLMFGVLLFGLLIFQALLGMWTVTLQLSPLIVTAHLLGGMAIVSLAWLLFLNARASLSSFATHNVAKTDVKWVTLGLCLVIIQIFLGAWTSTHYAALSCIDFPRCQSMSWDWDFRHAFSVHSTPLTDAAKMTIQMVHRFGALIVSVFLLWIASKLYRQWPRLIACMVVILFIQISLGVMNVLLALPIPIAIAHNMVAATLLVTLVTLNARIRQ